MVRLRDDVHAPAVDPSGQVLPSLLLSLTMNLGIDLRELEKILTVVTAARKVIRGTVGGQTKVALAVGAYRAQVCVRTIRIIRVGRTRQNDDCTVHTHLNLQIALRPAVIGPSPGDAAVKL